MGKFPKNKNRNLYEDDRVWAAFYRDGKTLGEICNEFDCVVYELTPWLTKPLTNNSIDAKKWQLTGFAVLPIEATKEMHEAGNKWSALPSQTWVDMVDAAPDLIGE